MKKTFLLIIVAVLTIPAISQQLPNQGFENWTLENIFSDPDLYYTSNSQVYMMEGISNVEKTTDSYHGNYAAYLKTVDLSYEKIQGLMVMGDADDFGEGGEPYSDMPDSLYLYAKYDIQPDDTAVIFVIFKNDGNMAGTAGITLTGTQSNYKRFSAPVNLVLTPDTIVTFISSSRLNLPPIAGSELYIDSIGFVGAGVADFPNGGFENWTDYNIEEPDDWFTSNFINIHDGNYGVTKSNDSYSGNYAVQLENTLTLWDDTLSFITNGNIGEDGPIGGTGINANPELISGYYKYSPVGNDTAIAYVGTFYYSGTDTILLDSNRVHFTAQSSYTYFEIPLNNHDTIADTLNVAFTAGNLENDMYVEIGSTLLIDDLSIDYYPVSTEQLKNIEIRVYPNPAKDYLYIITGDLKESEISLFDITGKLVLKTRDKSTKHRLKIDISSLTSGCYFYELRSNKVVTTGKILVR